MKFSAFSSLLVLAGLLASTPLAAREQVVYVHMAPASGVAGWGRSHGQPAWSGSISLGLPPAYVPVHGPYCGKAPRHHRRNGHRHHRQHARRYHHGQQHVVHYVPVYRY